MFACGRRLRSVFGGAAPSRKTRGSRRGVGYQPELLIADDTATTDKASRGKLGGGRFSKLEPSDETIANFNSRLPEGCSLKAALDSRISYSLISRKEITDYVNDKTGGGWNTFYQKHPKASGFVEFSTVGYNASGSEALVYLGHRCGLNCGTGHFYLLAKKNGRWVVTNRMLRWIS
jgi:hypothetical protein